jgi:Bacteriophage Gp15 protein.
MKLLESIEDTVEVDGVTYKCNVSVPVVFLYFEVMKDDGLIDSEKIDIAYRMLVDESDQIDSDIYDKKKVVEEIYSQKISTGKESTQNLSANKNYDFDQDNDLIYSSILQQYNINIRDKSMISKLRWHDFLSLFSNLDSKTPFGQAVFFRGVKITDDMDDEQRKYYREMKRKYALKENGEDVSLEGMDLPHKVAYLAKKMKAKQNKQKEG